MNGRVAGRTRARLAPHGYRPWLLGAVAMLLPAVLSAQDPTPADTARKDSTAAAGDTTPVALQGSGVAGERTHVVKRGNTLWDIARMYLNDPFQWPEVYRYNRDVVEDPHWIYPGEVLRIPGADGADPSIDTVIVEVADTVEVTDDPPRRNAPTVFTPQGHPVAERPTYRDEPTTLGTEEDTIPVVRPGQVAAAPWVDRVGGPRQHGQIFRSRELTATAHSVDRGPFQLHEEILFEPPSGVTVRLGDRYLAYERGPIIDGVGQLMVPTGIIQVVRLPERIRGPGRDVAGVAQVVRLFRTLKEPNRLIPFDPTLAVVSGRPRRMLPQGAPVVKVAGVVNDNVLPSIQSYIVIDASSREVRVGDEFTIFEPRRSGAEGEPTLPETLIGVAQVVRATPQGATAIVIRQKYPAIREGAQARLSAKTP